MPELPPPHPTSTHPGHRLQPAKTLLHFLPTPLTQSVSLRFPSPLHPMTCPHTRQSLRVLHRLPVHRVLHQRDVRLDLAALKFSEEVAVVVALVGSQRGGDAAVRRL